MSIAESGITTRRALPTKNPDNARFFESVHEHAMELQKCNSCSRFWYYPAPICPHCGSLEYTWTPVSGRATVYSFTWVHRPAPGFEDLVPYAYALVELDEGPILATNIVETDADKLKIGQPVEVTYQDFTDEITLPLFRPRR
jgi:hypothetical protein